MQGEINIFKANPLFGIGPGMITLYNEKIYGFRISTHTEITRILAEHGILGLIALLIIIVLPIKKFLRMDKRLKSLAIVFVIFALLSMGHSAMRVAMISFAYGLSFVNLFPIGQKNSLHRKQTLDPRLHSYRS